MSESEPRGRVTGLLGLVLLLILVLLVGIGGYVLFSQYNPIVNHSAQFREAEALQSAVRQRPLTAEEFAQCLRLCEYGDAVVQQSAIASTEAAVGRSPEFKPQAAEVLSRVAAESEPKAKASAAAVLQRFKGSP
jgi:type IV secretory pathway VirJ component